MSEAAIVLELIDIDIHAWQSLINDIESASG